MSGKYCLDANILIDAWHKSYPPRIFHPLWKQIALNKHKIELIKPIFNEIEPIQSSDRRLSIKDKKVKYPLRVWLEENRFSVTEINHKVNTLSLELEKKYETDNTSRGAGQIDITLIAYAKEMNKTIVTFEGEQKQVPKKKYNYKIPLICDELGVVWKTFIEMLDLLDIRIK